MSNAFFKAMSYVSCAILLSQCATVTNSNMPAHHQNTNHERTQREIEELKILDPQSTADDLSIDNSPAVSAAAPKRIALLLPVTGILAGPGGAVHDGFMAASKSANTTIKIYDTNKADVSSLYGQAIDEGADYIVGPLTKNDVAVVAQLDHPVPTLLLNDFPTLPKPNAFQFGLSPSGEAREVADKIRDDGYNKTLVIAPAGPWGEEVAQAFSTQLKANGGVVVDALYYRTDEDLNKAIKNFLQISDSEQRIKELKSWVGYHLEATPVRRQDFDTIFLLAYPSKARQLMPLLQYYYANNIPVYATSAVYAGNPNRMRDKDLDGIRFCDMPWVFKKSMAQKPWPEQFNSYNRLYALGMDSFALGTQLSQLQTLPAMGLPQKSGTLYLKPNQQVGRSLAWAKFTNGNAQLLENTG
jgi:outer membrane PBP1 activator LpoA protein